MEDKFILLSPSFIDENNNTFALISKEAALINAMRSFIDELNQSLFKITIKNTHTINNMPILIYDINNTIARKFLINQVVDNNNIRLSYKEIDHTSNSDNLMFNDFTYTLDGNFTAILGYANNIKLPAIKKSFHIKI